MQSMCNYQVNSEWGQREWRQERPQNGGTVRPGGWRVRSHKHRATAVRTLGHTCETRRRGQMRLNTVTCARSQLHHLATPMCVPLRSSCQRTATPVQTLGALCSPVSTAPSWGSTLQRTSYWLHPGGPRCRLCLKTLTSQFYLLYNLNTTACTQAPEVHAHVTASGLPLCEATLSPNRLLYHLRGRETTTATQVPYCRTSDSFPRLCLLSACREGSVEGGSRLGGGYAQRKGFGF